MKRFIAALFLGLTIPSLLCGQSTLVFSRVIQPPDFPATGFAIGNSGNAPANVVLTLHSFAGQALANSTFTVPPNGQVSKLASELFPNAQAGGWVEATSSASGITGFWLGGDTRDFGDGASAAQTSTDLVLPLVTVDSELNLANAGIGALNVIIRLYSADGREVTGPAVRIVPSRGAHREALSSIFPAALVAQATHARLTCCARPFAASIVARNYLAAPSWSVVSGVPASSPHTQMFFPHVVSGLFGGANYTSVLGVVNLSSTSHTLTLRFTPLDGSAARTVQRTVPLNGGIRESIKSMFGFGAEFHDGWLNVTSTGRVAGFVAYADTATGGVAVVAPQNTPAADVLFPHFAEVHPWMTGIAILNTNAAQAEVQVSAFAPDGTPIGAPVQISLGPMSKTASLLREWIPETQTRAGGLVRIRSNIPIFGMELFFTTDLKILSGIGSGMNE